MPRELITVQIGQCGNQIGCKFWEMALKEHAAANPKIELLTARHTSRAQVPRRAARNDPLQMFVSRQFTFVRQINR